MPEVHFIGTIDSARVRWPEEEVCVTWALVPGNEEWYIHKGAFFGETQISQVTGENKAELNHPIDVQFNTESSEGWPRVVCELWRRDGAMVFTGESDISRGFLGCGCAWLPSSSGEEKITVRLWKPTVSSTAKRGFQSLADALLPPTPDMEQLREITINTSSRATITAESVGEVEVSMNTLITKDFKTFGMNI